MYTVRRTKQFERSFKKIQLSGVKSSVKEDIATVIDILISGEELPKEYKDHQLNGELKDYRECHIRPDLLLIYQKQKEVLMLVLVDIGSHTYLFE